MDGYGAERASRQLALLDHGFIALEDVMGGDEAVARSARVCYQSHAKNAEADRRLIAKLVRDGHGVPLEFAMLRWHVKAPIFVARQWMRHRMGSFVEKSLRYCLAADLDRASGEPLIRQMPDIWVPPELSRELHEEYTTQCVESVYTYACLVARGVRKEQARAVLPMGLYTEFLWMVNARSLMNWLTQRLDKAAQWEHRQYARAALRLWEDVMPWTATAFKEKIGYDERDTAEE